MCSDCAMMPYDSDNGFLEHGHDITHPIKIIMSHEMFCDKSGLIICSDIDKIRMDRKRVRRDGHTEDIEPVPQKRQRIDN